MLTFNPRSKVTNIGQLLSFGAVFGWRSKIRINVGGFGDFSEMAFKEMKHFCIVRDSRARLFVILLQIKIFLLIFIWKYSKIIKSVFDKLPWLSW